MQEAGQKSTRERVVAPRSHHRVRQGLDVQNLDTGNSMGVVSPEWPQTVDILLRT